MTTFVVDDHGDVLVVAPVRELINPDVRQPIEGIWALTTCDDTLDNRSDGSHATRMSLTVVLLRSSLKAITENDRS